MILVHKKIIPSLLQEEKYDLVNQMSRASKAGPALIAEGFAKRYQKKNWKKYLDDALGESNEMIHHLSACIDLYGDFVNKDTCEKAIDLYDLSCRQMAKLSRVWQNFHEKK